jgi:phage nucleotide-binding protein
MSNFESPLEYLKARPVQMAIYAANGVGKTTFAGSTGLRTIYLDCSDAGVMSIRRAQNLKVIRIESIKQYLEIMDKIHRLAETGKIDLVVPDTLTGLQAIAIREVKGKRQFDMNQRKWGAAASRVIECLWETSQLRCDVIYLVQESRKSKEGDEGSYNEIDPSLTPSIKKALSGLVDWVGHLYVEKGSDGQLQRRLSFRLEEHVEAKDRSDLFPKVLTNPKYLPIRKRISEALNPNHEGG